jgi:hypothetical protein
MIKSGTVGEEWDIVMLPGDRQFPSGRDDWKIYRRRSVRDLRSDLDPHTVRFRRRILDHIDHTVRHEVTEDASSSTLHHELNRPR